MKGNYYINKLVACAIQFDKDFRKMEGGTPALDNITELILYIGQTMEISNDAAIDFIATCRTHEILDI